MCILVREHLYIVIAACISARVAVEKGQRRFALHHQWLRFQVPTQRGLCKPHARQPSEQDGCLSDQLQVSLSERDLKLGQRWHE